MSEFDFTVTYQSGWVYQVPYALFRLISHVNTSRLFEENLPCFSDSVLITTYSGNITEQAQTDRQSGGSISPELDEVEEDLLGEVEDFDLVDLAVSEGQEGQREDLLMPIIKQ